MRVLPPNSISDHSVIIWRVDFLYQPLVAMQRDVRSGAKLDKEKLRTAIINAELYSEEKPVSVPEFFDLYHSVLKSLADKFAPVKRVTIRQRLAVRVDIECIDLWRWSRMLYYRFRLNLPSDKLVWVQHEWRHHQIYRSREASYCNRQFTEQSKQTKKLLVSLLGSNIGKNQSPNLLPAEDRLL